MTTKTKSGLDVGDVGGLVNTVSEPRTSESIARDYAHEAIEDAFAQCVIEGDFQPHLVADEVRKGVAKRFEKHGITLPKPAPPDPFKERWQPLDTTWLAEAPPERPWLLRRRADDKGDVTKGFLPRGKVGMVVAKGGAGKTMALIQLALAVATGRDWLEYQTAKPSGRVLLALGEEDEIELRRRVYRAFEAMWPVDGREKEQARQAIHERIVALPLAGLAVAFVNTDPRTREVTQTAALDALRSKLEDGGEPWSLIVLDPLSRFAGAETETDNAAATRFVQAIESLVSVPGNPTVLVAHHTTKTSRKGDDNALDATAARGASALTDGVRWVLSMLPEGSDGMLSRLVQIQLSKSNYGPPAPPISVIREDEGTLRSITTTEKNERRDAIARADEDKRREKRAKAAEATKEPSTIGTEEKKKFG